MTRLGGKGVRGWEKLNKSSRHAQCFVICQLGYIAE